MSYIINNSRGQIVAVVGDGTINTTATDLALVGRAVTNYGEYQNENYVYLLENFANGAAPTQPILGQLWYNSSTDVLSAYNTGNTWTQIASEDYVEAAKISPAFTGVPTAPTAPSGTANTQLATTAFVTSSPAFAGVPTAPTATDATATAQVATTAFVQNNKVSPVFSGIPIAPTAAYNTNSTQIATTAFVQGEKTSPVFTGVPIAPTAPSGTATNQIATTAFVTTSPAFAGTPTAPTPSYNNNTNVIATTAFVQGEKNSPVFVGVPTAPTAGNGTANTQIATTEFVTNAVTPGQLVGTMAIQNASAVNITGGTINNIVPIAIADGGTGANSAPQARTNLGLQSGATTTVGTIATQNAETVAITGGTITGLSSPLPIESGGTGGNTAANARLSLGLGTSSTQNANNVNITGGAISGIAPLPVTSGGTGGNTAAIARTNLGLASGATTTVGTMAVQDNGNVNITGGNITGIAPLPVTSGGTGANTTALARFNLNAVSQNTQIIAGAGLSGGGDLTTDRTLTIASNSNGYGTRYVSTQPPTGGNDGDIWYQIA
jgi:hypothetical protein